MAIKVEIERVLAAITATLNDQRLERFETRRVQQLVTESLAGERKLTVDDGGGLHDETGLRIGAIRKTSSGEWITERQNDTAARSHAAIPSRPRSRLRSVLGKLGIARP